MTTTQTDNDTARDRLRAAVREVLQDVYDRTMDPDAAEQAVMDAAQQWLVAGYLTNSQPASTTQCSGPVGLPYNTVSREYAPRGWESIAPEDVPDPGPFTVGELVTCKHCGRTDVPVVRVKTNERETLTQYIGWLAEH